MADRRTILSGGGALAGAILVCLWPRALGHFWLAIAFFISAVPVGSILWLLMMRLIGGRWREALAPAMAQGARCLPVAAIAAVPILVAMGTLYPWVATPQPGFRGWWLAPTPFALRSLLWFAGLAAILVGFARSEGSRAIAVIGLLFLVPMGSLIAVDWLMSIDPAFHSSGFGLQALTVQLTIALMVAVLRAPPDPSGTVGALMLTLLMLWGYFAYLPYFILWSGNAPAAATWYVVRGSGGWGVVAALAITLHAVPLLALLSLTVRRSANLLPILALAILVGDALHVVWLVLPVAGVSR